MKFILEGLDYFKFVWLREKIKIVIVECIWRIIIIGILYIYVRVGIFY